VLSECAGKSCVEAVRRRCKACELPFSSSSYSHTYRMHQQIEKLEATWWKAHQPLGNMFMFSRLERFSLLEIIMVQLRFMLRSIGYIESSWYTVTSHPRRCFETGPTVCRKRVMVRTSGRHLVRDSWRLGAVVQGLPVLPRKHEGGLPEDEELVTVQVTVRTKVRRRAQALQEPRDIFRVCCRSKKEFAPWCLIGLPSKLEGALAMERNDVWQQWAVVTQFRFEKR
jgi:hypothetical protein